MKVLLLTSSLARFPGDQEAAHGNAVYELIREISKHVSGTVVAPSARGAEPRSRIGDLKVVRVGPERPTAALYQRSSLVRALRVGRALRTAASRLAPAHDVAHAFWAYPSGSAAIASGLPSVVTFPGSDIHSFAGRPLAGRIIRDVMASADRCVAVDPIGRELLMGSGVGGAELIPSPIRLEGSPLSPLPEAPHVVWAGRMSREKGPDVALAAISRARSIVPGLTATMIGAGPEEAAARELAQRLGLSGAVSFTGAVPRALVLEQIARSRALLISSRREGLPSVALEALASGRPVVTTDVGGLSWLLGREGGAVAPPERPDALAMALISVLLRGWDLPTLRARAEACSVERAAGRYVEMYIDVAVGGRRRRGQRRVA